MDDSIQNGEVLGFLVSFREVGLLYWTPLAVLKRGDATPD